MSPRITRIALVVAFIAIAAFVVSFVAKLRGDGATDPWATATLDRTHETRIRIEILNGAGQAGLAREATERLRDRGFDVVYFGNAREFGLDSSLVLDRVGREEAARAVADALGIATVRSEPDSTLLLEVTVILGKDWWVGR
jgi:hypothetical protein